MKTSICLLGIAAMFVGAACSASAADWDSFVIRNSTAAPVGTAPVINTGAGSTEFLITLGGQKAGWGTTTISGMKVGDITSASITRTDDYTRYATNQGAYYAPYMNIWITDGSGHFAIIANEPSNAEWTGTSEWNVTSWDMLKTKRAKLNDYTNTGVNAFIKPTTASGPSGTYTFADFAGYTIQAPTATQLATGWTGMGTGIARELGTNTAYGFNWIFGDTLANYVSGQPGFTVANPTFSGSAPDNTAVPEPMSIMLGLMGLGSIAGYRKLRK